MKRYRSMFSIIRAAIHGDGSDAHRFNRFNTKCQRELTTDQITSQPNLPQRAGSRNY